MTRHFWMVVRKDNPEVTLGCFGKRPYLSSNKREMVDFLRTRIPHITQRREWVVCKVWLSMEAPNDN